MKKNLVLLGMMGVGKSTLGKIVAKNQNMEFVDTDKNIEKKCSMKISEIFTKKGEKYFRNLEEEEVLHVLEKNNRVVALGGGAFINSSIRNKILENAISVWLDCDLSVLNERLKINKNRPLLSEENIEKKISELYSERKGIYKLANYKINCDNLNKEKIIKKIIAFYEKH